MKKAYTLTASLGTDNLAPEQLPEWYLIFAAGWQQLEGEGEAGKFLVDEEGYLRMQARINRRGVDVVFDYEHQATKDVQAPASGWAKDWRWTLRGIEAKVDWTETARQYLAKKEYRYISPVFYVSTEDKRIFAIHSVSLTNNPKTNNIQPLLAKLGAQLEQENEMLKKLIAKLSLQSDATEDQVLLAIDELLAGKNTDKKAAKEVISGAVVTALGLESNSESEVIASIHALKQGAKMMVSKEDFDALQAKIAKRDAFDAVKAAMTAGKITPDQKDWAATYAAADLAGFNLFVAKAPVVVPVSKLETKDTTTDDKELNATTLKIAGMMGIESDDIKKFGFA
jgi:phage I-like protein